MCFAKLSFMKTLFLFFYAAVCCSLLGSCQNNVNSQAAAGGAQDDKSESEKKISRRDYSINASNSYSNLFLDSMAMERFIADKKVSDSVARRMRSFYNTRNYQFAW